MAKSQSDAMWTSLSAAADVLVVKESVLALAIIKDGHVTLHSIEPDDVAVTADATDCRDEECKRLFDETVVAGDW
jgi:hypothetical protein